MHRPEINHVVFESIEVELINSKIQTDFTPLFFIKSIFLKKSGGKGWYNYYSNIFSDRNHNELEYNRLCFRDISCSIDKVEKWKPINKGNSYSVALTTTIKDRLGVKIEKTFPHGYRLKNRFKSLFEYLRLLDSMSTHASCQIVEDRNSQISKLKKEIEILKKKSTRSDR